MEVQFATPTKGVSTPDLIKGIQKEGEDNGLPFPIEKENYLRNVCSSVIKPLFPDRVYSVARKTEEGAAVVYWTAKEEDQKEY